ncbi:MOSC domain-containing protein [Erythrobacter sp. NFXS35]|uniref:MOSC domain-containing protein n=1 Tax=Erythrobacter sp. NFXS35 TaxID=2818436 RepID=UPI0032DF9ABC
MSAHVIAVSRDACHNFSKQVVSVIDIVAGLGVAGDAHSGVTVKHRSRIKVDPSQPNLRQVHLIHSELFDELSARGFLVRPGDLGENITTSGIDLLSLPRGAILRIGGSVRLQVTGLRNPCAQIDNFQSGLLAAVLDRGTDGTLIRKSGIMAIALDGGPVRSGNAIAVEFPGLPFLPLERV